MAKSKKDRDAKRRQKAARRTTQRKQELRAARAGSDLAHAASWPFDTVLVNATWKDSKSLVHLVVSRRRPDGFLSAALMLVDLQCWGVKDVIWRPRIADDGLGRLIDGVRSQLETIACTPELAAKIVRDAARFGSDLGLPQDPALGKFAALMKGVDPNECDVEIPLGGGDGRPFYVAGPRDDARAIIAHLQERLGVDGFEFFAPM